jgi:hypothetical protein
MPQSRVQLLTWRRRPRRAAAPCSYSSAKAARNSAASVNVTSCANIDTGSPGKLFYWIDQLHRAYTSHSEHLETRSQRKCLCFVSCPPYKSGPPPAPGVSTPAPPCGEQEEPPGSKPATSGPLCSISAAVRRPFPFISQTPLRRPNQRNVLDHVGW